MSALILFGSASLKEELIEVRLQVWVLEADAGGRGPKARFLLHSCMLFAHMYMLRQTGLPVATLGPKPSRTGKLCGGHYLRP